MSKTHVSHRSASARIDSHIANLGSPNRIAGRRAEHHLMRYYQDEALVPLIAACDSDNSAVRDRAVWVLGHTHDPGAYDTVLRLTRDPDGAVRYDAAIALGILGDLRAVMPLVALLTKNTPSTPPQPWG
ncbi:MAG: HEAT repeat domain-containing protein [Janthinobacterium lividum]